MSNLEMVEMSKITDRDTFVFFGGLKGQMAVPWFEFKGVAQKLGDVNKLFIRDLTQTWYHQPYYEVLSHLDELCGIIPLDKKLTFVGNSMGAYAAYWFGSMYDADEVIMFSPQTCLDKSIKVDRWGDISFEREIQRELKQLDRERAAIQAALEKALADAKDEHSEEVERLKARLKEAEERSERTKSRAEMTRSGHVYVISNIGSFGEGVFKIGLTRRLEPDVRVRELSNASVPFGFDVHMMISSDDAPALENELHRALHRERLNKVNPRKEFFRTDIETLRQLVEKTHGEVSYIADAEALEYHQSIEMSEEDFEFIEASYEALEDEENEEPVPDDV